MSEIAPQNKVNLKWLIEFYNTHQQHIPKKTFYNKFFIKLAGTPILAQQIEQGLSVEEIRETWKEGIADFKIVRNNYLLYK